MMNISKLGMFIDYQSMSIHELSIHEFPLITGPHVRVGLQGLHKYPIEIH